MHTGLDLQGHTPRAMDFRFLFLEPQGRLAPKPFGRGFVLLTAVFMLITIAAAIAAPGIGVLQYALVFPYICLFGKRLHDAGLSAWLWLAYLLGFSALNMFISILLLPVLSPDAFALQAEMQEAMETRGLAAGFEMMAERAGEIAHLSVVTTVAAFLISSALTGFAAYRMRSDKTTNRHGPPTDDTARVHGTFS
jgi:uncharacterized membrane protein YhaH (DUF805 family)